MPDSTRQPAPEVGDADRDDDRDRTIESLLVTGLDRYFAGEYERAIHAWTRVLFLDRTHARARAYIERARSVLAERQRETDELLHRGLAALDAGDTDHARTLLASAVQRGGAVEAAEVALERVARLNVASGHAAPRPAGVSIAFAPRRAVAARDPRRAPPILALLALCLLLVAAAFALRWDAFGSATSDAAPSEPVQLLPHIDAPLPRPELADLAVRRAKALFARGHLHDALSELDAVREGDPQYVEAERLRADVQRALLEAGPSSPSPPAAVRREMGRQ
jgi:hypothetical protein